MGFFKNLFGKKEELKEESFIPSPTQSIPGLEPIVVYAIENLYPNMEDQKIAFEYSIEYLQKFKEKYKRDDTQGLLAMLAFSNGNIKRLPESSLWFVARFRMEVIDYEFPKMKDVIEWVKSISKPKV